ncbi:MAG TPA: 3-oxoacyl-ACP reductase FabG [Thermoanaerobaculia bacterium]|jgi:3-oxoacyl-[acyl-carrier protein] reductase|nr:3-oxoacyl-ACP reductase FabG [Thermoanaerobaculia bacterium]
MSEKVVIVTGGAAGIGRATARRFATAGARVAVWDVQAGGEGDFQTVDVTNAAAVEEAVAAVVARWGRIDVLVNNAGILRDHQLIKWKDDRKLGEMTERDFDAVVAVNQKGVFLCTRAVVPPMIAGGGGVILNASSVVGLYGNFGQTNYAATKAAVINMTKTWARELGRYNIRVNAVAPGFIATEMVTAMPEKVLQGMISHTPLGRMGKPEDIAEAYFWLASDAADFITGTVLSVDGGLVVGT